MRTKPQPIRFNSVFFQYIPFLLMHPPSSIIRYGFLTTGTSDPGVGSWICGSPSLHLMTDSSQLFSPSQILGQTLQT